MKKEIDSRKLLAFIIGLICTLLLIIPLVTSFGNSNRLLASRLRSIDSYASSIKLQFMDAKLVNDDLILNKLWVNENSSGLDDGITCGEIYFTFDDNLILNNCFVKDETTKYCYYNKIASIKCDNENFVK